MAWRDAFRSGRQNVFGSREANAGKPVELLAPPTTTTFVTAPSTTFAQTIPILPSMGTLDTPLAVQPPAVFREATFPMATVGLDTNLDGNTNVYVTGVDRNHDGIPDVLQRPVFTPSYTTGPVMVRDGSNARLNYVDTTTTSPLLSSREIAPSTHIELITGEGGERISCYQEWELRTKTLAELRDHARDLHNCLRHKFIDAPPAGATDVVLIEWILQAQYDAPKILSPRLISGKISSGGIADLPLQEVRTVIREVPQEVVVDKHVIVPRLECREVLREVPQILEVEKVVEVEVPEILDVSREVLLEQHRMVDKGVPRMHLQPFERIESVPINLRQEYIQEVPRTCAVDFVKEIPQPVDAQVRIKEVAKPVIDYVERLERVKAMTLKEQIVEVPVKRPITLTKEVPIGTVEQMERTVIKPVCELTENIERVDMVEVRENIIETPDKIIVEYIRETPKIIYEEVVKKVPKPVIEYEYVTVEVPHYVTVEEIVEVEMVERIECIKRVPVPVVEYVDRRIPRHEMNYRTKILEYPITLKQEIAVEVPEIQNVDLIVEPPKLHMQEVPVRYPKVRIEAVEVIEDVGLDVRCEKPVVVHETLCCECVTEVPREIRETREKLIRKEVYREVDRFEKVSVEVTEEIVEYVPKIQTVELHQEELHQVVKREKIAIPQVNMEYVEHQVEVDWRLQQVQRAEGQIVKLM